MATPTKFAILMGLLLFVYTPLNENIEAQVATVADAKQVFDLSVFPMIEPEGDVAKTVAWQSYRSRGKADEIAQKVDAALVAQGLRQLEGSTFSPAYCSATYGKGDFHFVLSVFPSDRDMTNVTLVNIGNVDFRKLPITEIGRELFVQPASAIFTSEINPADARQSCRELLEKDGWEEFGETTVSFYMRKNAIRLQVMCSESPTQPGQSMIQVSAEQMSSALPIIPGLVRIAYTEPTGRLDGDSKLSTGELVAELRQALEQHGWTATTTEPLKINFRDTLIFRNADSELVELSVHEFDTLSRFEMKYQTSEQVAADNELAKLAAEKAKEKMAADQDRRQNPVAIVIEPLELATLQESKPQVLEFSASSGQAQSIVKKWIAKQETVGWSVEEIVDTKEIGEYRMTKGDQKISVSFIDPGFIPAEITIKTGEGYKLEVDK